MATEPKTEPTGLALLRVDFPEHQISKLPKPTKAQTDEVKSNFKAGVRCEICGSWHHPKVVHLDYVGHAALTDRLLDADPNWTWEPLSFDELGLPRLDKDGGMWIRLTVCGITRLGYGDAQDKQGGDATKERIGDALRNAAMRFGAALDLWHKGDLHIEQDDAPRPPIKESAKSIGASDFDRLPEDRKKTVADLSIEIIDIYRNGAAEDGAKGNPQGAYDKYLQAKVNLPLIEEQTALRGQFASDIKTAFQKIAAARKAAKPTADELLNTP